MRLHITILPFFVYIFFLLNTLSSLAQIQKTSASQPDIFGDLPIDDPNERSYLNPKENAAEKISRNIFLTGHLDKTTCYVGEPVLLSYELLSAIKSTSSIIRTPSLTGFQVRELVPNNDFPKNTRRKGLTYNSFVAKLSVLIPVAEGDLEIGSMTVDNKVTYTRDKKDFHYSGSIDSKPLSLRVEKLPEAGKLPGFEGAVGNFYSTRFTIAKDTVYAGQNNQLEMTIGGEGNINSLTLPQVKWPASLQHFEISEQYEIEKNSFPVKGSKTFIIPFVIEQAGNYVIPPFSAIFFDPHLQKYRRLSANSAVKLMVLPSPKASKPSVARLQQEPKKNIPGVIYLVVGSLIFIILIAGLLIQHKNWKTKKLIDELKAKESHPANESFSRLQTRLYIVKSLDPGTEYIIQLRKILVQYLYDDLKLSDASYEQIAIAIGLVDEKTGEQFSAFMKDCDLNLYAPINITGFTCKQLSARAEDIAGKVHEGIG